MSQSVIFSVIRKGVLSCHPERSEPASGVEGFRASAGYRRSSDLRLSILACSSDLAVHPERRECQSLKNGFPQGEARICTDGKSETSMRFQQNL
jgi:hypothetical protein